MAGAPRICSTRQFVHEHWHHVISERRTHLHGLDSIMCLFYGVDRDEFHHMGQQELVHDRDVIAGGADGGEACHLALRKLYCTDNRDLDQIDASRVGGVAVLRVVEKADAFF